MSTDSPPTLLGGRYRLAQRFGSSPEATTWLARDETTGDSCVVKIMLPGLPGAEDAGDLLRREVESLRAVSHPQLVPLKDIVLEPERGVAALVMPRVPGEPLDRLVGQGSLPPEDIAAILVDCARGLGALHQRGLLHRDIHPRNVVIAGPCGRRRAVIVDFGLVTRRVREFRHGVSGTLGYLAPESLLSGVADVRTDLYSLGALLFFMVAGEPPIEPQPLLDGIARGLDPFTALEDRVAALVPEPFRPLAARLLARYPAARYQTAAEIVEAVNLRCGTRYEVETTETRRPALGEPPFFGRTTERRTIFRHVLGSLDGGGVAIVAVRGGRGMGKTRLLAEARRAFDLRGVPILAIAPRAGSPVPAGPVLEGLRSLGHRLPPGLAATLGQSGESPALLGRSTIAEALQGALSGNPRGLLVVDDADRLDPSSWEVLARFLFGEPSGPRTALLSLSAAEGGKATPAQDRLARLLSANPSCHTIDLLPLSKSAQEDLVRSLLPVQNLGVDVVKRVAEVARGSPAAVIDVVRSLMDSGRVVYTGGGWILRRPGSPIPVPRSLAEAAHQRLEGLSAPGRLAIEIVGLLGGGVPAAIWPRICEATGLPETSLRDLIDRGFLVATEEGARLELASRELGLNPETKKRSAARLEALRIAGHLAATESTLEPTVRCTALLAAGRPAEVPRILPAAIGALRRQMRLEDALWLVQETLAALGESPLPHGTTDWLLEGARIAGELHRVDVARSILEKGLHVADSIGERHALLALSAEQEAGEGRLPEDIVRRLESEGADAEPLARARLALAKTHYVQGRLKEALATVQSLLPMLGHYPHLLARAQVGLANVLGLMGLREEARAAQSTALGMARDAGDIGLEFVILRNLVRGEIRMGKFRSALRLAKEGRGALAWGGNEADEIALLLASVSALESLGKSRLADPLTLRAVSLAEGHGDPSLLANAWRRRGWTLGMLGRQEEAVRALTRSLQVCASAGLAGQAEYATLDLVELHLMRGEKQRARECFDKAPLPSEGRSFTWQVLGLRLRDSGDPGMLERIQDGLRSTQSAAFPEARYQLRLLEIRALLGAGMEEAAAEKWTALQADCRRQGVAEVLARCLALSGTVHAREPRAATRGMRRAVRLARRLHGILVRADVLEACGRFFAAIPAEARLGKECLDEAASLFGSASLPGRAENLRGTKDQVPAPSDWRGLRPEKLNWVLDRTEEINQVENPEDVLAALLESAISFTGAERGFLVLASRGGFEVRLARSIDSAEIGSPGASLSASLVRTCIDKGESILSSNAESDGRFSDFFSVRNLQLRSILVVPITRGRRVLGAFYLDNRFLESVFSDQDRLALERFAAQAGLAFENVRYRAEVRDLVLKLRGQVSEQSKELATIRTTVREIRREAKFAYKEILRGSGSMAETLLVVDRAVESDVPVLLEGESGTGKELVARAIHFHGPLQDRPFVTVNCAAIPETLIESELFGHRKGAFTGALVDRVGRFDEADGGTLFLDEVGDLPLSVQPKILRAIQFGEIAPLGGGETGRVRVRIVAATNRDLRKMMEEGKFREDLFYRLAVFPIRIPPLRDRMEDIPDLAAALVRKFTTEAKRGPRRLSRQGLARLLQHEWPGNIRELENVLRRAVLMTPGDIIGPDDLPLGTGQEQKGLALLGRLRDRIAGSLKPRDELVLRKVLERGRLTLREYVAGTRISKATATRDLRRLVSLKILVRRGSTAAAYYELAPRLASDDRMTPNAPSVSRAPEASS